MRLVDERHMGTLLSLAVSDVKKRPDHEPYLANATRILRSALTGKHTLPAAHLAMMTEWSARLKQDDLYKRATSLGWMQPEVVKAMGKAARRSTEHPRVWTEDEKATFTDWEPWRATTPQNCPFSVTNDILGSVPFCDRMAI